MHNCTSLSVGSGVDYHGQIFDAIFEPGEMKSNISIDITDDTEIENDEIIRLDIQNNFSQGFGRVSPHRTSVVILDDDCK